MILLSEVVYKIYFMNVYIPGKFQFFLTLFNNTSSHSPELLLWFLFVFYMMIVFPNLDLKSRLIYIVILILKEFD